MDRKNKWSPKGKPNRSYDAKAQSETYPYLFGVWGKPRESGRSIDKKKQKNGVCIEGTICIVLRRRGGGVGGGTLHPSQWLQGRASIHLPKGPSPSPPYPFLPLESLHFLYTVKINDLLIGHFFILYHILHYSVFAL